MEFSEVVSAHFAVPVVGVVVCAVLVFAFGFKSPVQPPSFDLLNDDDDEGKYRKSRHKKHKTNLDGHVIYDDGRGSLGMRATVKQHTALNKQLSNEKCDLQIAKVKHKKAKQVMDSETSAENFADEQTVEASGEWTKAVSKKDRKNRGKKDECMKIDDSSPLAHAVPKVEPVANNNQIAENRREVNLKVENSSNRTCRKNLEVTVTAPAPVPTSECFASNVSSSEPSYPPSVNVNDCVNTTKPSVVQVSIVTGSTSAVGHNNETKLSGSNSQKLDITSQAADVPLASDDCVKTPAVSTVKASVVLAQAGTDKPKNCGSGVTARATKLTQSPKKKKTSPENREKYKEPPVVTIPGYTKGAALAAHEPKVIVKIPKNDAKLEETEAGRKVSVTYSESSSFGVQLQNDSLSSDDGNVVKARSHDVAKTLVDNSSPADVNSTYDAPGSDECRPSSDNLSQDDSQTLAIADELGDWQQAKQKKKRKPQKENWD